MTTNPAPQPRHGQHRWRPGQSGNLAGRPPGVKTHAADLVREKTDGGKHIIDVVYDLMFHAKHEATRISAAEMLASRLWGRPLQEVALSGQVNHLHLMASWSDEELEKLVAMRGILPEMLPPGDEPATVEGDVVEGEGQVLESLDHSAEESDDNRDALEQ